MNCITNLPSYAQSQAQAFKNTGKLEGDDVKHIPIPAEQVDQVELQLTQELAALIAADNTEMDQNPEVGKVTISQMGMTANASFEGDTEVGCMAMDVTGPMNTAAHAEFTDNAAQIVQVLDLGGGEYASVGAHLDRAGGESYIEAHNVPDGFNLLG